MKITYVVHQFLPRYFTGTEQFVFAVASHFQSLGHDVEVFCLEPDFGFENGVFGEQRETVQGLDVVRFRYWRELHRDFLRLDFDHPLMGDRFARYLEERRPDLVHVFHLRYLGANLLEETQRLGIPAVVHLMDFWFLCPAVTLMMPDGTLCEGPPEGGLGCAGCMDPWLAGELEDRDLRDGLRAVSDRGGGVPGRTVTARAGTLMMRPGYMVRQLLRAQRILAPSRFLRDMHVRNGVPADRIEVLPYGVEVGVPRPSDATRSGVRVGFMGSLAPHKGVHVLIQAMGKVKGDIRLLIHGRTTDFPGYSHHLQELAAGDDRVEIRGPYSRDELERVLAEMDVLVLPSLWYENTPFVALEAFAAGVPVLATNLGGLAEIVQDGVNGELFRKGGVTDLGKRLQRIADRPEILDRYRDGIGAVRTLQTCMQELEAVYRSAT